MCFSGDVCYSYTPDVSTDTNLSEPKNPFFTFGSEEWTLTLRYPSGLAKGQGGPIASGQASSIQRNNLCSILPTSAPLIPELTLMLQGVFYDPITQHYTLSGLGVRLQFKIAHKDSSQDFPLFMSQWPQRFVCVVCICGYKGDQLLNVLSLHIVKVQPGVRFYFHLINRYLSDWEWYLKEKC